MLRGSKYLYFFITIFTLLQNISCGKNTHFEAALIADQTEDDASEEDVGFERGDIIIVSGGTVARTATPFPLHRIALFNSNGVFKRFLYEALTTEFLYGAALDYNDGDLIFGIDTVDRLDKINATTEVRTSAILNANLTGTTIRAVESLSDGAMVVAESATVIEKFNPDGTRVTTNFPLTIPTAINNIKRISGDRFVVTFTTNPDAPSVYNNDGTLATTMPTTSPCTTNCDPYDIVELADGRFVLNSRITHGLYLYSSTFVYIGVLYLDTTIINAPSAMSLLENGNLLVCNTNFNTCEELAISGTMATRVGTNAFIGNTSIVRQPTSVMVVP